jgi:chloramphenicol 3-O phosphotransferase
VGTLVRVSAEIDVLSEVNVEVLVLNGGSSSGKSSIATCLQQQPEQTWLTLGVDELIRALSHGPTDTTAGAGGRGPLTTDDRVTRVAPA